MILCRRTVLLLASAWFLMQPPWSRDADGRLAFDTTRPILEWQEESSFRTMQECESGKLRILAVLSAGPDVASDDVGRLALARLNAARCVTP